MSQIEKQKDFLNLLSKSKRQRRNGLINTANKNEINSLCECLLNALEGNFKLTECQKKHLKRRRRQIHGTLLRKNSLKKRKTNLKQIGGFMSTLIPLAITALTSLLPKLIS